MYRVRLSKRANEANGETAKVVEDSGADPVAASQLIAKSPFKTAPVVPVARSVDLTGLPPMRYLACECEPGRSRAPRRRVIETWQTLPDLVVGPAGT